MDTKTNQYDCRGRKQGAWNGKNLSGENLYVESTYIDGIRNGRYSVQRSDGCWLITNCVNTHVYDSVSFEGELILFVHED